MEKLKLRKEKYSIYFIIVSILSVVTLLISNVTSSKLFEISNIVLPVSILLFPITYIIGDVISEVYGYKKAKFIIILGFLCNLLMVAFFEIAIILPPAAFWQNQEAYSIILGTTPRMFIASLSAFLLGSLSNAYAMALIKKITKGKFLWVRTIGSTIIGELLDTLVFVFIGFYETADINSIFNMILCQYIWKLTYEVIITPITYLIINKFNKLENNYEK